MRPCFFALLTNVSTFTIIGCTGSRPANVGPGILANQWRTLAERSGYQETGRYAEVVEFCRRLAQASPLARYTTFGVSGEGRELPLLILSRDRAFTPQAAQRGGKPLVMVQNCIHPGECAGKDASLALARDILITGTQADLLEHVNLLILPIFNVDGHERFGPYGRINQNGPREMGWRTTAVNLNLNRDYTKAEAVEMQAWLRLWNAWQPDLLIDNHTTDGEDHRYELFYAASDNQYAAPPIVAWIQQVLYPELLPALAEAGQDTLPYCWPRNQQDLSSGLVGGRTFGPRYSTGYAAVCNRPALLVEVHARKPYAQRVRSAYEFLRLTLEAVNRRHRELREAIRQANQQCTQARGGEYNGRAPLHLQPTDEPYPIVYKGVETTLRHSEITGGQIAEYSDRPLDVETDLYDQTRVSLAVTPPAAYLIPPQWTEVIDRLELHGVGFFRLGRPQTLEIESYRFEDVKFADWPQEGRQIPEYRCIPVRQTRELVAGTVVVPLDQPRAKLAIHLLEPESPDSLVAWGFFNAIFEQKEYAEADRMEPIARRMLADDPALRDEFEARLRTDPAFASDPGRRLDFFYRRSPYWDPACNLYPVARLTDPAALSGLSGR
jgi:hypothetical protein